MDVAVAQAKVRQCSYKLLSKFYSIQGLVEIFKFNFKITIIILIE